MKKLAAILLVALLAFSAWSVTVVASGQQQGDKNAQILRKQQELEQKYGISIRYPTDTSGNILIAMSNLETLDAALNTVTPAAVREVSEYYRQKNGNRLTFRYVQSNKNLSASHIALLAGFDNHTSLIELYIPSSGGQVLISGDSPVNIVHEFGHALHLMFTDSYGFDRMQREWTASNGGVGYDGAYISQNPDDRVFVSGYAATAFAEDVAEVIGHTFIRNRAGQGFAGKMTQNGQNTGLGNKVVYVEKMIAACLSDSAGAVENFRKAYTASTSVKYQGMSFSGDYLQYMGYAQPRYVLSGTLANLGKKRETAYWLTALGGWYVKEPSGREILVFPGGVWCEVGKNFQAPAPAA